MGFVFQNFVCFVCGFLKCKGSLSLSLSYYYFGASVFQIYYSSRLQVTLWLERERVERERETSGFRERESDGGGDVQPDRATSAIGSVHVKWQDRKRTFKETLNPLRAAN